MPEDKPKDLTHAAQETKPPTEALTFLIEAVDQNPGDYRDQTLLGLSSALITLDQKDKALEIIGDVVNRGEFMATESSCWGAKRPGLIIAELFFEAGKEDQAKPYLEKAEKSPYYQEYPYALIQLYEQMGMTVELKSLLLRLGNSEVTDDISIGIHNAIENGFTEEAKQMLQKYKTRLTELSEAPDTAKYKFERLLQKHLVSASFTAQLEPGSAEIDQEVQAALDLIPKLPEDYGSKQPFPLVFNIRLLTRAGKKNQTDQLVTLLAHNKYRKYAYLTIAAELIDLGDRDGVAEYYAKAMALDSKEEKFPEIYVNQIKILKFMGRDQEIPDIADQVNTTLDNNHQDDSGWRITLAEGFIKQLAESGYSTTAEAFLKSQYMDRGSSSLSSLGRLAIAIGEKISPSFLMEVLCCLEPKDRMGLFLGGFEMRDVFNVARFIPYLTDLPPQLDFDHLKLSILRASENKSLQAVQEFVVSHVDPNRQDQLTGAIKFLMLEGGTLKEVNNLFDVLSVLKEKLQLDRLSQYQALVNNDQVKGTLFGLRSRRILRYLAKNGVVTESKHLFYLDTATLIRINNSLFTLQEKQPKDLKSAQNFLTQIMAQQTTHMPSVMLCVEKLGLHIEDGKIQQNILTALDQLGGVTPTLFKQFLDTAPEARPAFIASVKKLRGLFYQNRTLTPELVGLSAENFDELLAEYITILFKPVGFSADKVLEFMKQIKSHSYQRDLPGELEEKIKLAGEYWDENQGCFVVDIDLEELEYRWKTNAKLDPKTMMLGQNLNTGLSLLSTPLEPKRDNQLRRAALITLIKQGNTIQPHETTVKMKFGGQHWSLLPTLLSFLPTGQLERLQELGPTLKKGDPTEIYTALNRVKEILGVKTPQGYSPGVVISDHWKNSVKTWLKMTDDLSRQDVLGALETDSVDTAADKLLALFEQSVLTKVTAILGREEKKFEVVKSTDIGTKKKTVKMYVSKNIPSFFAKASVGICTAKDIELFARADHFHINVVDNDSDEIIGNVQAYLLPQDEQTYLMLRGINPTVSFVDLSNVRGLIERVLTVGKEIAQNSNLDGLALSESLAGWHADSNRPEVASVIRADYLVPNREMDLLEDFPITANTHIRKVYIMWQGFSEKSGKSS